MNPAERIRASALARGWDVQPFWSVARRFSENNAPDRQLLSVYRDWGVVPKASRDDNFNRASDDLSTYQVVRQGDLVINKMKTWQGSLAVSDYGGIVSPAYFVCGLAPSVHPRFIHYALRSTIYVDAYASVSKGIRPNQWDLPYDELRQLPVILPPIERQRRIADFLDDQVARIDEIIRLREETTDVLAERLAAAAHGEVTGIGYEDRAPTDLPWSDFIPSHWQVARLGLIAQMGTGHTPSRLRPEYWEHTDIPWLTTTDVKHLRNDEVETLDDTEVHISDVGLRNSAAVMHPAGTVGICRTSASAGYSAIMGVPMATSQDFAVWRPATEIVPGYLLWCLRAMRTDLLERLAMGSTHKTIYFPDLEGIQIPLPPVAEQAEIAQRMHRTVGLVAAARAELRADVGLLRERKRSLITAAVTGEIDVTSASGRGVA